MQHERLAGLLKELKLGAMAEQWDEIVVDGIRRKRGTLDILERLLTAEHIAKTARSIQNRISQARFPQHRSLADF
ncbi:ATP-binding protein, partial [Neisseria wadsworthii]